MDRLLTGRRIINSENHLRELWPFLTKKLAKSCYFDFYVPITPKPEICRRHFSLAAAEKGGWAQVACPSGLRQALTTPKCSSAGTMSILACGGDHWIVLTERGGLMVRGDNAEGQLGIGTRNSEWYPTGLGGIGSVVGDEVTELVGGVHALALLAATQAHAAALPAGVLAHPFDDKALLRLVLPALGYNDFRT